MAITINLEDVINKLASKGYTAIGDLYLKLKEGNATFLATFNSLEVTIPNGSKYDTVLPSSFMSVNNDINNKAFVMPFVISLNSFLTSVSLEMDKYAPASSKIKLPVLEGAQTGTFSGGVGTQKIEKTSATAKLFNPSTQTYTDVPVEETEPVKKVHPLAKKDKKPVQSIAQTALFQNVGAIPIDGHEDNKPKAIDSTGMLQAVQGTSDTSTYYTIARGVYGDKEVVFSARVRQPQENTLVVSLRAECKGGIISSVPLNEMFTELGYEVHSKGHASIHFTAHKVDAMKMCTTLMYTLPIQFTESVRLRTE